MNTSAVGSTVRVGNHALSAEEQAAGAPPREPYVGGDGAPADPAWVRITLQAPTGTVYTYRWPTILPGDEGLVQQESTGRFYVDHTPLRTEDWVWTWEQEGADTGSAVVDQDPFYVKRPIVRTVP